MTKRDKILVVSMIAISWLSGVTNFTEYAGLFATLFAFLFGLCAIALLKDGKQ